jgi:glycosyltransferase involved in cell wall biosynthesis
VRTYPYTPRQRFPNFGTRFRKLAERLSFARRAKADVIAARHDWVILTKPFDFFWSRLMPAGHPTRFAFMSGGTDFMRGDRWLSGRIAAMVACSHFNAQQNYARFKRRVGVIFNGVDTSRFLPGQRDVQRRRALGFQPWDVVFVFAGRLIGLKGLHLAVQALAEPSLAEVPAKLLIVGNGDALPRLQRLAADLGVGERIVFHPAVPHAELPVLYACADVGLFPGLGEEAFGISVAEAMACGLPVVASYNGGMPEVIGNEGSCGRLFALGDVEACAGAMAGMCASPELRRSMGAAARLRIETQFTWRQAAERLLAAINAAGPKI